MLRPGIFKQPISYHYDVYASEVVPAPLLVCLHGYGQTKEIAFRFGKNIRRDWTLAALQAPHAHHLRRTPTLLKSPSGVGFSWVSPFNPAEDTANHHNLVKHVIDQAVMDGLTGQRKAFLFGFSQSVSLNYRFALAHPEYVAGIVAVAGATPSDWVSAEVKLNVPVLHLAPEDDEAYPAEKTRVFRGMLERSVRDLTWMDMSGGHRVPSAGYPVIREWLEARAEA